MLRSVRQSITPKLMVTQIISWGVSLSFLGVLALPVSADLDIPIGVAYAGASLFYGIGAVSAGYTGRLCDRHGGLPVLAAGSIVFMVALLVIATSQNAIQYLVGWGVFGAGMNAALATGSYSAIVQSDEPDTDRSIATLTLATGLSSSVFWPLSSLLIGEFGWRFACLIYALLMLTLPFAIHFALAQRTRAKCRETTAGSKTHALPTELAQDVARALFWFKLANVCAGFYTAATGVMMIGLYVEMGIDSGHALIAASFLGFSYILGRLIYMALSRWVSVMTMAVGAFVLLPLSIVPLLIASFAAIDLQAIIALVSTIAFGIASGIITVLRPTYLLCLVGRQSYGRYVGQVSGPLNLASAVAPLVFGTLLGISNLLYLLVGLSLATLAVFAILAMARVLPHQGSTTTTVGR